MLGEHWRLLYVAMTRARDRLIVCGAQFGNATRGEAEESWRLAVEEALRKLGATPCETPYGEGLRLGAPIHADARAHERASQTPLPHWAKIPARRVAQLELAAPSRIAHVDATLFSPRGDGRRRFRRGLLIHGLLQRLPEIAPERRLDAGRAWLKRQGADDADIEAYAREALGVINDARFAAAFGPHSRAEAPVVGEAVGKAVRGIVDRLAIDDDRVLVLDFKSDRPAPQRAEKAPQAYILQLALYREVLRNIFPAKRIDCALLWTEAPLLMPLPDALLDAALQQFQRS
jgi:ATP-dependent helicase/nuclease subunit A